MSVWTPRVTVAAIVCRHDRYLLVKEMSSGRIVYNQPAGHLEDNETLIEAIKREMIEETGLEFNPTALIGIYRLRQSSNERTYLRFAFTGDVVSEKTKPNDKDILDAMWMNMDQISALSDQLRSPQVMRCIDDYCKGIRYNLDILGNFEGTT